MRQVDCDWLILEVLFAFHALHLLLIAENTVGNAVSFSTRNCSQLPHTVGF